MQFQVRWFVGFALAVALGSCRADELNIPALLQAGQTGVLDRQLLELQRRFESNRATEVELRDTYRGFYDLTPIEVRALQNWASSTPNSYPARLGLGVYYAVVTRDHRGYAYVRDTDEAELKLADHFAALARGELRASMTLTPKPYLSAVKLLDVAGIEGDRQGLREAERSAVGLFPGNYLAREIYQNYLRPRWGGSYSQMENYVVLSRREGAPAATILRLEALELDDKALTLSEHDQVPDAIAIYKLALDKASLAGGDALTNDFADAREFVCSREPRFSRCR